MTHDNMDQSYEELMIAAHGRKKRTWQSTIQLTGRSIVHRAIVLGILTVFYVRTAICLVLAAAKRMLLGPWDLALCALYWVWSRNPSAASSAHLSLNALRTAFWGGEGVVAGTGMHTVFIKGCSERGPEPEPVAEPDLRCKEDPPEGPTKKRFHKRFHKRRPLHGTLSGTLSGTSSRTRTAPKRAPKRSLTAMLRKSPRKPRKD